MRLINSAYRVFFVLNGMNDDLHYINATDSLDLRAVFPLLANAN